MESRSDILLSIRDHLVVFHVSSQQDDINLRIFHTPNKYGDQLVEMRLQSFLAHRLICQREPEFTGLKRYGLIGVLSPLQHVVDNVVHVWYEPVHSNLKQHDHGTADILAHIWFIVLGQDKQTVNEVIDMKHQGLYGWRRK